MKKSKINFPFWNFPTEIKLLKYLYFLKDDKSISKISYDLQISYCLGTRTLEKMRKEHLVIFSKGVGLVKYYSLTEKGKIIAIKLLEIENTILSLYH